MQNPEAAVHVRAGALERVRRLRVIAGPRGHWQVGAGEHALFDRGGGAGAAATAGMLGLVGSLTVGFVIIK